MTSNQQNKVCFPQPEDMGPRDWGKETLLVLVPGEFSLKKLFVKAGSKGGLQYHHKKNECGYIISGKLLVKYDLGNNKLRQKILKKGDINV